MKRCFWAGLEEHIATLDIGPHMGASGIGEQADQVFHRQQVFAADVDPPQQGHVSVQTYPKRVINCWILSFSSFAGLYFKDSRSCSSALVLSPFCEYAIPRW